MERAPWTAVFRLGPLARLARAHVLGDITVLPNAQGEASNQQPLLGPPKMTPSCPSWHSRSTCARSLPPEGMHSRSAMP